MMRVFIYQTSIYTNYKIPRPFGPAEKVGGNTDFSAAITDSDYLCKIVYGNGKVIDFNFFVLGRL